MKKIKWIFTSLSLLFLTQLTGQGKQVTVPFSSTEGEKVLEIDIFSGSVEIKGSQRNDVLIEYSISKLNEDYDEDEGKEKSQGLKRISGSNFGLEIGEDENTIYIESQNWTNSLNLVIEVPTNTHIDISKNIGKLIQVENIAGNVNVENNVGEIMVNGVTGLVNASTNAGNIKVEFDGIPEPKTMKFISTTGDIDITLPSDYKADLKMKTDWGEVYSDMEIATTKGDYELKTSEDDQRVKYYTDTWTRGTINGGGTEITLKTQMGSIYLRKS